MPTNRVYRIAVIPGDGIGKEVDARGRARAGGRGEEIRLRAAPGPFRFRLLRLLREARPDDAGGLEGADRQARRDLLRRGRLAGEGARPHLAVGLADPVPPRVRPVRQSAPGAADARRAVAARRPQARRHRLLGGAREHRGRVFGDRRPHVRRHRARGRRCRRRCSPASASTAC